MVIVYYTWNWRKGMDIEIVVGMETGGYRLNWKSSGQVPSECDIVKSSKLNPFGINSSEEERSTIGLTFINNVCWRINIASPFAWTYTRRRRLKSARFRNIFRRSKKEESIEKSCFYFGKCINIMRFANNRFLLLFLFFFFFKLNRIRKFRLSLSFFWEIATRRINFQALFMKMHDNS